MSRKRIDSSEVGLTPRTVTRRDALRILIGAGMCAVLSPVIARAATTQEKLDAGTLDEVLTVHQYGVAMTILNASMRIMRISHIDMQRVLYSLTRDFDAMCRTATRTPLEQMSNYAPMTDILAASHVKAHVRLFMG